MQGGKYELLDRIAQGGMAELFRARALGAEGFTKLLAIKRILPAYADDEAFIAMLVDEARIVSGLSHPNVVQVHELGRDEDGLYIAMELVNGPNLAMVLRKLRDGDRRMPVPCAVEIIIHVLEALDHAHHLTDSSGRQLGLVHRDVSPQNVLLDDTGAVKLGDFGIAKAANRIGPETQAGSIKGKVPYLAPEQVRKNTADARSDQFAAALILWECLAGIRHFKARTDVGLLEAVAKGHIRRLDVVGVTVDAELERQLMTALSVDPADRHESCGEFAQKLTVYHRRTWPEHRRAHTAALVQELFAGELRELADRLRRFESGELASCGWVGRREASSVAPRRPSGAVPASLAMSTLASTLVTEPGAAAATRPGAAGGADPDPLDSGGLPPAVPVAPERPVGKPKTRRSRERPLAGNSGEGSGPSAPGHQPARRQATQNDEGALVEALKTARAPEAHEAGGTASRVRRVLLAGLLACAAGAALVAVLDQPAASIGPAPSPATPLTPGAQLRKTDGMVPPEAAAPVPANAPGGDSGATSRAGAGAAPENLTETDAAARSSAPTRRNRGHGTLDVLCKPVCNIEIDGRNTGLTSPATGIVLSAGSHKIRAFNRMLNLSHVVRVNIVEGKTTTREINLVLRQ